MKKFSGNGRLFRAIRASSVSFILTFLAGIVSILGIHSGRSFMAADTVGYYALGTLAPWLISVILGGCGVGFAFIDCRSNGKYIAIKAGVVYSMSSVFCVFYPVLFFTNSVFVPFICGILVAASNIGLLYLCSDFGLKTELCFAFAALLSLVGNCCSLLTFFII